MCVTSEIKHGHALSRLASRRSPMSSSVSRPDHNSIPVKRFLVAIPTADGGVELHPMKEWLRQHPDEIPDGLDATMSTSHQLRNGLRAMGWTVQASDTEVRLIRPADADRRELIDDVLGDPDADESDLADQELPEAGFALEYQLRDFLSQNLSVIRLGDRPLKLYVDPTGREGVEFPTAVGPIDILAVDSNGDFVVFELKRARIADRAVGQLARYMGWVKHTIGRDRGVFGVVVAKQIDERLRYAASVIPGVSLYEYQVEFRLTAAHL